MGFSLKNVDEKKNKIHPPKSQAKKRLSTEKNSGKTLPPKKVDRPEVLR